MTVTAHPDELVRRAVAMAQLSESLAGAGDSVRRACSAGSSASGRPEVAHALAELDAVWGTALLGLGQATHQLSDLTRRRALAFGRPGRP